MDNAAPLQKDVCAVCDQPGVKRCGACKTVYYCSIACQTRDWKKQHHLECESYQSTAWRYQVHAESTEEYPSLVSAPATHVPAVGRRKLQMPDPNQIPPRPLSPSESDMRRRRLSSRRADTAYILALTWDMDERANNYNVDGWRDPANPVGQAWRAYFNQLDMAGDMPEIITVALQAAHRENGIVKAFQEFLGSATGDGWEVAHAYDASIIRSFATIYQSHQLVYWRPSRVDLTVWKTGTTCFRVGLSLGLNCEYGAAGAYFTYSLRAQPGTVGTPIPAVAISTHFSPKSSRDRVAAYKQVMKRLVPKLLNAKTAKGQIRPPLDCVAVIMAGDMGWRKKQLRSGFVPPGDPLTLARFGDSNSAVFPFPEWAEVGQPAGAKLPLLREFVPPYRPTCPMHTEKTFLPYPPYNSILQARQEGTELAFNGDFPPTHCDRVFVRLPQNVYSLSVNGWSAALLVPQSVNGRHEAVAVQIPMRYMGACTDSPIAARIGETAARVASADEAHETDVWHDELAISSVLSAYAIEYGEHLSDAAVSAAASIGARALADAGSAVPEASAIGRAVPVPATPAKLRQMLGPAGLQELLRSIQASSVLYERLTGTDATQAFDFRDERAMKDINLQQFVHMVKARADSARTYLEKL